jgi:Yip1-like protein
METLGLMFKTLWAPGEAMFLVSKRPRALLPLILMGLVSLGVGIVAMSRVDIGELALRQAEQSGRVQNMSEEQKQRIVQMGRTFGRVGVGFAAVGPAILILVATAIYFGIFTMLGREANFTTFLAVTTFAYVPIILRSFVSLVQVLAVPPSALDLNELGSLSLAIFLDRTAVPRLAYAAASVVDIFSIWIVILLIIAYKFVTRKSVGTGLRAVAVAVVYVFFSMIGAGLRMLQGG